MNQTVEVTSMDDYLASVTPEARVILSEIRRQVQLAVPNAQETISYKIPAFKLNKTFFYFAAFKKHVGIYPPVNNDANLEVELRPYSNEKGNLKFPLNKPMPYALIVRVAVALSKQYS
jgi:uncharacterized protein YdhG (YjbR/CyaY superfamily)